MASKDPSPYVPADDVELPSSFGAHLHVAMPSWVTRRADMPRAVAHANLARANADMFEPGIRDQLVRLVEEWPRIRRFGESVVIAGRRPTIELQFYAAAVINEIVLRYAEHSAIRTGWVGLENLHWMQEASRTNGEAYTAVRNRVYNTTLLFVENPLRAAVDKPVRFALESLYQHRSSRKTLPTITTLRTDLSTHDWSTVESLLGPNIAEQLSEAPHQILLSPNSAVPAFSA